MRAESQVGKADDGEDIGDDQDDEITIEHVKAAKVFISRIHERVEETDRHTIEDEHDDGQSDETPAIP